MDIDYFVGMPFQCLQQNQSSCNQLQQMLCQYVHYYKFTKMYQQSCQACIINQNQHIFYIRFQEQQIITAYITHSSPIIIYQMSKPKDYDQLVKLILIGSSGVGKSSLLIQFAQNKFNQNYLTTIGVDFRFKTLKIDGKSIKFQIWDTAGQDRFRTITSSYYKNADGIIMVYDISDKRSFEDIDRFWVPEAENYVGKSLPVILLGNKEDAERVVDKQKGKNYATSKGYDFEQVSAKTSDKVFDTIRNFGKKVLEKKNAKNEPSIDTSTDSKVQKGQENTTLTYPISKPASSSKCC